MNERDVVRFDRGLGCGAWSTALAQGECSITVSSVSLPLWPEGRAAVLVWEELRNRLLGPGKAQRASGPPPCPQVPGA